MSINDAEVKGKGKGKEKEMLEAAEGDNNTDEWDDSFIPTYVYDALKEKKRFDHMRVRSSTSHAVLTDELHRAVIKKMRKSFLAFI